MEQSAVNRLSSKVEQLLAHCNQLESDNEKLKALQNDWQGERTKLLQKNDLARNKIEAMIGRLKSLEQS